MTNEDAIKVMNTIIAGVKHNIQLPMTVNDIEDACYMAIEALKEQSITHCKDCKYFRTPEKYSYKEPNLYCCRSALTKMSENDFCSKAIRREGDDK